MLSSKSTAYKFKLNIAQDVIVRTRTIWGEMSESDKYISCGSMNNPISCACWTACRNITHAIPALPWHKNLLDISASMFRRYTHWLLPISHTRSTSTGGLGCCTTLASRPGLSAIFLPRPGSFVPWRRHSRHSKAHLDYQSMSRGVRNKLALMGIQ